MPHFGCPQNPAASRPAKLSEIQLTLGISDLFAKQLSTNIILLARNLMARLSQGTSLYCYETTFLRRSAKKIHEISELKTLSKKTELITHERPDDCEISSCQDFYKRSLLWLPCAVLCRGFSGNKPAPSLTGRHENIGTLTSTLEAVTPALGRTEGMVVPFPLLTREINESNRN